MASYAHIEFDLKCEECGYSLFGNSQNLIGFQWGYCPSRTVDYDLVYSVGDRIRWPCNEAGVIKPWVYFEGSSQAGNIGDSKIENLIVAESEIDMRKCPSCKYQFGKIGILIENSLIKSIGFYASSLDEADIYVLDENGLAIPMPEFDDHLMPEAVRRGRIVPAP